MVYRDGVRRITRDLYILLLFFVDDVPRPRRCFLYHAREMEILLRIRQWFFRHCQSFVSSICVRANIVYGGAWNKLTTNIARVRLPHFEKAPEYLNFNSATRHTCTRIRHTSTHPPTTPIESTRWNRYFKCGACITFHYYFRFHHFEHYCLK